MSECINGPGVYYSNSDVSTTKIVNASVTNIFNKHSLLLFLFLFQSKVATSKESKPSKLHFTTSRVFPSVPFRSHFPVAAFYQFWLQFHPVSL